MYLGKGGVGTRCAPGSGASGVGREFRQAALEPASHIVELGEQGPVGVGDGGLVQVGGPGGRLQQILAEAVAVEQSGHERREVGRGGVGVGELDRSGLPRVLRLLKGTGRTDADEVLDVWREAVLEVVEERPGLGDVAGGESVAADQQLGPYPAQGYQVVEQRAEAWLSSDEADGQVDLLAQGLSQSRQRRPVMLWLLEAVVDDELGVNFDVGVQRKRPVVDVGLDGLPRSFVVLTGLDRGTGVAASNRRLSPLDERRDRREVGDFLSGRHRRKPREG